MVTNSVSNTFWAAARGAGPPTVHGVARPAGLPIPVGRPAGLRTLGGPGPAPRLRPPPATSGTSPCRPPRSCSSWARRRPTVGSENRAGAPRPPWVRSVDGRPHFGAGTRRVHVGEHGAGAEGGADGGVLAPVRRLGHRHLGRREGRRKPWRCGAAVRCRGETARQRL